MTAQAANRPLLISDLLCFATKKYGRVALKPLKSVLLDFYSGEEIAAARELLYIETDKLLTDKWTKPVRRRKESINRTPTELDDILQMIAVVDNAKAMSDLPMFVSADPDKMPSVKLTEGDLAIVLLKLSKIEEKQDSFESKLNDINTDISRGRPPVIRSVAHGHPPPKATSSLPVAAKNSSVLAESQMDGRTTSVTSDVIETSDNEGELTVVTHRRKKRKQISTPPAGQTPSYAAQVAATGPHQSVRPKPPNAVFARKKTVIGASSTSSLKASKTIIVKKAVFRLGNIDSCYTVENVEEYIQSIGVRILTCFELKNADRQPLDNKAFRICIVAEDKQKLCDSERWAVGISLREWTHRPKDETKRSPGAVSAATTSAATSMQIEESCAVSDKAIAASATAS
jgi:hypothetical protein